MKIKKDSYLFFSVLFFIFYFIFIFNNILDDFEYLMLIILTVSISLIIYSQYMLNKIKSIESYLLTDGEILSSKIKIYTELEDTGKIIHYYPKITYKYFISKKEYISTNIAVDRHTIMYNNKEDVESIINKLRQDNKLSVYYSKINPSDSVLIKNTSKKRTDHYKTLFISGIILFILFNIIELSEQAS